VKFVIIYLNTVLLFFHEGMFSSFLFLLAHNYMNSIINLHYLPK